MGESSSKPRDRARRLRRDYTDAEQKLWARLRAQQLCGAKFRRQHPIGPFIADFCCPQWRIVIEVDGGHHAVEVAEDQRRSQFLQLQGYRVLRFWDHDVLGDIEAVLEQIVKVLSYPHPDPLPGREREKKDQHQIRKRAVI